VSSVSDHVLIDVGRNAGAGHECLVCKCEYHRLVNDALSYWQPVHCMKQCTGVIVTM